jgi:4-amino-4-deoxy-L-arabinose transferase-like glycosyltransferase
MSRWGGRWAVWAVIAVPTLLRLGWAWSLGPAYDEAYYFEYVRHLDWAYFDHPPMTALVGLPGIWLAGDAYSVMGLRVGFLAMFAGSTWLMARLGTRFFGPAAGVLAAFLLNVSGYFGVVVGTIAQPDGPLLFFWLLTLDRLAAALDRPEKLGAWAGVGLAWGGAMLSKYHAALLPAGALLYLAIRPESRRCLRRPGPYLASAIGLAMFAPVVAWNASHGWASFRFQAARAVAAAGGVHLEHLATAIGMELLFLFPWLLLPLVWILAKRLRRGPKAWDAGEAFLIAQALPALVLFHAVAAFRHINAYWPLFGFVSLMPLFGRALADRLHFVLVRHWLATAAAVPILLAAGSAAQLHWGAFSDDQGRLLGLLAPKYDPTVELICWDQVAAELERRGLFADPSTFLITDTWDRSAKLSAATRGKVPVTCYAFEPRSFLLWNLPEEWVGRDGVFIEDSPRPGRRANYSMMFQRYEQLGTVHVTRRGAVVRELNVFRGTNQLWPFPFDGRREPYAPPPAMAAIREKLKRR